MINYFSRRNKEKANGFEVVNIGANILIDPSLAALILTYREQEVLDGLAEIYSLAGVDSALLISCERLHTGLLIIRGTKIEQREPAFPGWDIITREIDTLLLAHLRGPAELILNDYTGYNFQFGPGDRPEHDFPSRLKSGQSMDLSPLLPSRLTEPGSIEFSLHGNSIFYKVTDPKLV